MEPDPASPPPAPGGAGGAGPPRFPARLLLPGGALAFAGSGAAVWLLWKGPLGAIPNPLLFLGVSAAGYGLAGGAGCALLGRLLGLPVRRSAWAGFAAFGAAGFVARLLLGFAGLFGAALLPLAGTAALAGLRILLYTLSGWFGGGLLEGRWPFRVRARAPLALAFGLGEAASGVSTASFIPGPFLLFLAVAGAGVGWVVTHNRTGAPG